MRTALIIAGRELRAYVRSPLGFVIAAAMLLVEGLWFQTQALGTGARLSSDVLAQFFYGTSGVTMFASIVLSMRLVAQEHERGSFVLLNTAPVRESEIVAGKFLAVFAVLAIITAASAYMPALIFVNGRVSIGHILVGYLGVLLLGASAVSIGLFASALARSQVIAAILGTVILGVLLLLWLVARVTDPPVNAVLSSMSLHHERFRAFMLGILRLENVLFYLGVSYFFLLAATKTLEARRWR